MTKKSIFISPKSKLEDTKKQPDDWVSHRDSPASGKMKRLTIDVPQELHSKIKVACALRGAKMADEIRAILEREFSAQIRIIVNAEK